MRKLFAGLVAAVGVCLALHSLMAFDEVTYQSFIDKKTVKLNESVQFMIVVNYSMDTMAPTVTPPSFVQFSVVNEYSSSQQVQKSHDRYMVLKKIWMLKPEEIGRLSVAGAVVIYQDPTTNLLRTGKTAIQFVTVEPVAPEANAAKDADPGVKGFPWWWMVVGVLTAGGLYAAAVILFGRPAATSEPKTLRISHEQAALAALQETLSHLERDDLQGYLGALTRSLLDYLQNRFDLNAYVISTPALLDKLKELKFPPESMAGLDKFFHIADQAKFAGYAPSEDEIIALHSTVKKLIEFGRTHKYVSPERKRRIQSEDEDEEV